MMMTEAPPATTHGRPASSQKRAAKGLLTSLTAWLVALLAALYLLTYELYPWKNLATLEIPLWIVEWTSKVPRYIAGHENADIVLLGSSLLLAPSIHLDDVEKDSNISQVEKDCTVKSTAYQNELKRLTGKTLTVKNLAVAGAMVTDQAYITRHLLAKKHPGLLVYALAPRDFIDNQVGDRLADTPVRQIFNSRFLKKSLLPSDLNPQTLQEFFEAHQTFCRLLKKQIADDISRAACHYFDHPATMYDATKGRQTVSEKMIAAPPEATGKVSRAELIDRDLALYKTRYLPPNQKRFDTQVQALEDLIKDTKEHHVPLLLVEMPLSARNLDLLQPAQKAALQSALLKLCHKYDVEFIDYNSPENNFGDHHFGDSVHVNKAGAVQFVDVFCKSIKSSRAARALIASGISK